MLSPRYHLRCSSRYSFPAEALPLPFPRRQHAGQLALDVDAGLAAEPELRQEAVRVVDVGLARQDVVVRVAGSHDRLVHVHGAVAALLVVVEPMRGTGELEISGIEDRLRRRTLAGGQRRQRKERLDRRAGRVRAAQRTIRAAACPATRSAAPNWRCRCRRRRGWDRSPASETIASTSPVAGSSATSAPRRVPNAASATSCSLMSSVSVRSLPDTGATRDSVRTARPPASTSTSSTPVVPCNSRSYDSSMPDLADVVGALVVRGLAPFVDARDDRDR